MNEGELFVVATPIGNLEDITFRAIKVLKNSDLIVCEDTRKTLILLNKYGIKKKLFALFKGKEKKRTEFIINMLKEGKKISLVSESGTPGICDPGAYLLRRCHEENIKVSPIPGPSALTSSLSVSGMDGDNFLFLGFPPKKESKRKKLFSSLKDEKRTTVFYLSPHNIDKILQELKEILGVNKKVFLIREMTKKFEEYIYGTIEKALVWAKNKKGEFTLVIEGKKE
ncbi:MAG: 16S rRNA (cytidine(1402)-2'-O)-methyltransferase [candidate division WOR-3 bacterium]